MRQERVRECFHKIISYQHHPNCTQIASICQKQCQSIHSSNNQQITVSAELIYSQYKNVKKCFIQAIKTYTDKLSKSYEEMMRQYSKSYSERLREMQKQLLAYLMKNISINKDVLEKIENDRVQKLRCSEVHTFLQDTSNIQQKVKSAPLESIYLKHIQLLKKEHQKANPSINQSPQVQNYKRQIESLERMKGTLQKQLGRLRGQKRKNLKVKTWNILRIATKKRIKDKQKGGAEMQEGMVSNN